MNIKNEPQEIATLAKKMSNMSRGERASKYEKLSDQGVDENVAGFLAFADDDDFGGVSLHLALAADLEEKAAEMTPASRKDTLRLVKLLKS